MAADGCGVCDMRVACEVRATRYMRALRVVFHGEEGQERLPVGFPMMPLTSGIPVARETRAVRAMREVPDMPTFDGAMRTGGERTRVCN